MLQTMHSLHGCTCRLLVAHTVRHASTGTPMECVTYFLIAYSNTAHASTWEGLRYQFQLGSVSACFKYQCSYLNILQASLLHSCLHDKAKRALMQVQACSWSPSSTVSSPLGSMLTAEYTGPYICTYIAHTCHTLNVQYVQ